MCRVVKLSHNRCNHIVQMSTGKLVPCHLREMDSPRFSAVLATSQRDFESLLGNLSITCKYRHFDIYDTDCRETCTFDNFRCSQWRTSHQDEDATVWLLPGKVQLSTGAGRTPCQARYTDLQAETSAAPLDTHNPIASHCKEGGKKNKY